jgi:hypothetical protein
MKFRKKPVVIEAEQFVITVPDGVPEVLILGISYIVYGCGEVSDRYIEIPTLEGTMRANHLDWIIKGINGEFYPIKEEIFFKTYEKAE